ncbi:MAG TPA: hypothetical protein VL101_03850, partial [Nordella sp.]|nr:hypothetical protein [Nordella sp.]
IMHAPAKPLIGQRILRKEDRRFITGEGRYVDDIVLPGLVHADVLRSPHAHARINSIATKRALAMPGVLAIYTGAYLEAAQVGTLPVGWIVPSTKGRPMAQPPHPVLASEHVRHVGGGFGMYICFSNTLEQIFRFYNIGFATQYLRPQTRRHWRAIRKSGYRFSVRSCAN